MKFQIESQNIEKIDNDCLVVGIYEKNELTPSAKKLDQISQHYLTKILKNSEMQGKVGQTMLLHHVPKLAAPRVLLVGCGKHEPLTPRDYRRIINSSIKALNAAKVSQPLLCLLEVAVAKYDMAWKVKQAIEVTGDALYQFTHYKSDKGSKPTLQVIKLFVTEKQKTLENAVKQALAITAGIDFTKDLANTPSNICNPSYLANQAKALAKKYKSIKVKVLEESDMEKLGMGAFLAVAKGSAEDAKLVCLEYKGTSKKQAPIAFVGKGITFDTGGISLKPADGMVGMKYDMCGAATVLGLMKTIAELKLPLHIVGVLATAENMPSSTATKPEDIVTSLSGQTIEIMNTDAEGRLV